MKSFRTIKPTHFAQLVKERRTAINFDENVTISEEELNDIFELTRYAPSCYNLQHVRYKVMIDRNRREEVKKVSYDQHKTVTASAIVMICANPKAYLDVEQTMEKHRNNMDEQSYREWIELSKQMYKERGEVFQKDEAIRNGSLAAMLFMLAAKDKGWDTAPMIGFDENGIRKIFQIEESLIPVLMVTIGKQPKQYNTFKRPPRKEVIELVEYI
ncbi:MAG TPA: nitroreductase family protein [Massilibacterium sp.]|nr:nitroreductase family protein [Massilibacterium sp.]